MVLGEELVQVDGDAEEGPDDHRVGVAVVPVVPDEEAHRAGDEELRALWRVHHIVLVVVLAKAGDVGQRLHGDGGGCGGCVGGDLIPSLA